MKPILEINNISKKFRINHELGTYLSLRDRFAQLLSPKNTKEDFWALKDITFNVEEGDSVAIIGKNGAGKSTLLKILSKITPPTSGKIISRGRMASLLEVGTGFHSELSGRENIFMNGSILGMKRSEIAKNFDAIVDFSGVEKFIDTPLKHYSSGMQLRLAFAVAAFLENEILIIDEVLAVGDADFQKKCMGKMGDISKSGRTILFVSHNMGAVSQLCNRGIVLFDGKVKTNDKIDYAINQYLNIHVTETSIIEKERIENSNQFVKIFLSKADGSKCSEFKFDEDIIVNITLQVKKQYSNFELAMRLIDRNKNPICTIHEKLEKFQNSNNLIELKIKIPKNFLTPNSFSWVMCINNPGVDLYDLQDDILNFTILETGSEFARYSGSNYGSVFAKYEIL